MVDIAGVGNWAHYPTPWLTNSPKLHSALSLKQQTFVEMVRMNCPYKIIDALSKRMYHLLNYCAQKLVPKQVIHDISNFATKIHHPYMPLKWVLCTWYSASSTMLSMQPGASCLSISTLLQLCIRCRPIISFSLFLDMPCSMVCLSSTRTHRCLANDKPEPLLTPRSTPPSLGPSPFL